MPGDSHGRELGNAALAEDWMDDQKQPRGWRVGALGRMVSAAAQKSAELVQTMQV